MGTLKSWAFAAVAIGSFFVAIASTFAGTYNFYFNNTEQGDNSTANPAVDVGTGEKGAADSKAPAAN